MVKPELGTKRICPETGRKFYDLNRDPIVSPYTGVSYPRSYFDEGVEKIHIPEEETEEEGLDTAMEKGEFVSLEDADAEEGGDEDLPDLGDEDVDIDDDGDTFLEEEEEEDDDVSGILGGRPGEEDEA